jgi:gas vesicle protein
MGETVDALGYKADVPARAKESVSEKVESVKSKISGLGSRAADATPEASDVKENAQQAVGIVQENPLGMAIGAAALGFLAGMLVPSTRIEDERIGPVADQVKEQARQTGQEALEHGREIARETAETATQRAQEAFADVKEQARENVQSHAGQVSESASQSVEQVKEQATRQN